ncbi:MAG: hypothetical protein GY849_19525 [Deltaproteobacteria bacterium]|nr:hypothetical protein [Deltaproteobacteria bacterium]
MRWKGIYAEESAFQNRLLSIIKDPDVIELKKRMVKLRAELSMHKHHSTPGRGLSTVRYELNQAKKEIREIAKVFKSELEVSGKSLNQVLGVLPRNSGLIEFRLFTPYDLKTREPGKAHLAACLLLSDIEAEQQVFFKDLGAIEKLLKSFTVKDKKPDPLYQYLLGKFDDHIKNLEAIYVAPDSFLNLISFASLRLPDGKLLVERQRVHRLQTGRDLLASIDASPSNLLIAMGGVSYGQMASGKKASLPEKGKEPSRRLNMRAAREIESLKVNIRLTRHQSRSNYDLKMQWTKFHSLQCATRHPL